MCDKKGLCGVVCRCKTWQIRRTHGQCSWRRSVLTAVSRISHLLTKTVSLDSFTLLIPYYLVFLAWQLIIICVHVNCTSGFSRVGPFLPNFGSHTPEEPGNCLYSFCQKMDYFANYWQVDSWIIMKVNNVRICSLHRYPYYEIIMLRWSNRCGEQVAKKCVFGQMIKVPRDASLVVRQRGEKSLLKRCWAMCFRWCAALLEAVQPPPEVCLILRASLRPHLGKSK